MSCGFRTLHRMAGSDLVDLRVAAGTQAMAPPGVISSMVTALRFIGNGSPEDAEQRLRTGLPQLALVRKAAGLLELQGEEPPELARAVGPEWCVYTPVAVDISPPQLKWQKARSRLAK